MTSVIRALLLLFVAVAASGDVVNHGPRMVARAGATSEGVGTTSLSWTHTVTVGTAQGIVVFCAANEAADVFTGATYGGVAMTQVASATDSTEAGFVEAYTLFSGIPAGSQTVACTVSAGSTAKWGMAWMLRGDKQLRTAGDDFCTATSASAANPSCTISNIPQHSFVVAVVHSGVAATSSITAGSGYVKNQNNDYGALVVDSQQMIVESYSGNQTVGFTIAADDYALVAVAVEITP